MPGTLTDSPAGALQGDVSDLPWVTWARAHREVAMVVGVLLGIAFSVFMLLVIRCLTTSILSLLAIRRHHGAMLVPSKDDDDYDERDDGDDENDGKHDDFHRDNNRQEEDVKETGVSILSGEASNLRSLAVRCTPAWQSTRADRLLCPLPHATDMASQHEQVSKVADALEHTQAAAEDILRHQRRLSELVVLRSRAMGIVRTMEEEEAEAFSAIPPKPRFFGRKAREEHEEALAKLEGCATRSARSRHALQSLRMKETGAMEKLSRAVERSKDEAAKHQASLERLLVQKEQAVRTSHAPALHDPASCGQSHACVTHAHVQAQADRCGRAHMNRLPYYA